MENRFDRYITSNQHFFLHFCVLCLTNWTFRMKISLNSFCLVNWKNSIWKFNWASMQMKVYWAFYSLDWFFTSIVFGFFGWVAFLYAKSDYDCWWNVYESFGAIVQSFTSNSIKIKTFAIFMPDHPKARHKAHSTKNFINSKTEIKNP